MTGMQPDPKQMIIGRLTRRKGAIAIQQHYEDTPPTMCFSLTAYTLAGQTQLFFAYRPGVLAILNSDGRWEVVNADISFLTTRIAGT